MIPAEYDVLISFAPVSAKSGKTTNTGSITLNAFLAHIQLNDYLPYMTSFLNVLRPGENDIFKLNNIPKILAPGEEKPVEPTPPTPVVVPEPTVEPEPEVVPVSPIP